jgi:2-polyprenyl-3-methyl-5-hydroxy-6-metoxy-1,4-benzoquinol methylase
MDDLGTPVLGGGPDTTPAVSFRDPSGGVFRFQGRVLRVVNASGAGDLASFLTSRAGWALMEGGQVVRTRVLDEGERRQFLVYPAFRHLREQVEGRWLVEHERIPFPSYPYEWPPGMLHAAGELTLRLASRLLHEGLGLKDATPYNVCFRGPEPVFVDVLSFERRDPADPIWVPHAQFARTFLLPLLAHKHLDRPLGEIFISRRDGLDPEDIYRWSRPSQRLRSPFVTLASIPTWLARGHREAQAGLYRRRTLSNPQKACYIVESLLKRSSRTLDRLAPIVGTRSPWSEYMTGKSHYSEEDFAAKERFVEQALVEVRPRTVLDIGCNTGHFSLLAARRGAAVVAIDRDVVALTDLWRRAKSLRLDVLPLHVDFSRPTPPIGWRNQECSSFLDRARRAFDAVLMLAVLHHLLVVDRIPLADILGLAAALTTDALVIEFIAPHDPMFRRLARGRDELHTGLSREVFEHTCRQTFAIVRSQGGTGSSRFLYLLRKQGR